ncbi:hypothetical protein [Chroococcidiopsis sp.]|uniref:hypothetical protein n=1 Tax=Chroococcidiopsis sp. TaxID=3088168 RepID=UPI003F2FB829
MIKPNRIYKLSGDVNELDYGAKYFRCDSSLDDPYVCFEVWELVNLEDSCGSDATSKYWVQAFSISSSDLSDRDLMLPVYKSTGISSEVTFDEYLSSDNLLRRLNDATQYGKGISEHPITGNNAAKLLGFNPSNRKYAET